MPRGVARSAEEALIVIADMEYEPLVEPYPGPRQDWRVRCLRCGHPRTVEPRVIASGRRPCQGCVVAKAQNDVAAAGLAPGQPYPGSSSPWLVRCPSCWWSGTVVLDKIRQGRRGCRGTCATARSGAPGVSRRLDAQAAAADMRAAGFEPLISYPGAAQPWSCRHVRCGQVTSPTLANLKYRPLSGFCAECSPARRLSAAQVDVVFAGLGVRREGQYRDARSPLSIRCLLCGLPDRRRYDDILATGVGCSFCAGKKMHASTAAALASRAGLDPLEPFPGATSPWRCRCRKCGRQVTPPAHQLRRGGGCSTCANRGFDAGAPGLLYLLTHHGLGSHKFGITNTDTRTQRIATFRRAGWLPLRTWSFPYGWQARDAETHVKRELRVVRQLPPFLSRQELSDGWTETVGACSLSTADMARIAVAAAAEARGSRRAEPEAYRP